MLGEKQQEGHMSTHAAERLTFGATAKESLPYILPCCSIILLQGWWCIYLRCFATVRKEMDGFSGGSEANVTCLSFTNEDSEIEDSMGDGWGTEITEEHWPIIFCRGNLPEWKVACKDVTCFQIRVKKKLLARFPEPDPTVKMPVFISCVDVYFLPRSKDM